jgi:hypothetical protein
LDRPVPTSFVRLAALLPKQTQNLSSREAFLSFLPSRQIGNLVVLPSNYLVIHKVIFLRLSVSRVDCNCFAGTIECFGIFDRLDWSECGSCQALSTCSRDFQYLFKLLQFGMWLSRLVASKSLHHRPSKIDKVWTLRSSVLACPRSPQL